MRRIAWDTGSSKIQQLDVWVLHSHMGKWMLFINVPLDLRAGAVVACCVVIWAIHQGILYDGAHPAAINLGHHGHEHNDGSCKALKQSCLELRVIQTSHSNKCRTLSFHVAHLHHLPFLCGSCPIKRCRRNDLRFIRSLTWGGLIPVLLLIKPPLQVC